MSSASGSTSVVGKCAKCNTNNPTKLSVCRICGATLPWAMPAAPIGDPMLSNGVMPAAGGAVPAMPASGAAVNGAPLAGAAAANAAPAIAPPVVPAVRTGPPNVIPNVAGAKIKPGTDGKGDILDLTEDKPKGIPKAALVKAAMGLGALLFFFLIFNMTRARPVPAPTNFIEHATGDGTFKCEAPEGWNIETTPSANGVAGGSTFSSGTAKIKLKTDLAGSVMGDLLKDPKKTPLQILHEAGAEKMKEEFGDYDEMPSKMYQGAFGETWYCEFTGKGGFREGAIHGYRATMMGGDKRIRIIATCRESDWETLKPAFDRVLNSMKRPI